MSVKISVIDMTGNNRIPGTVYLEGKLSKESLEEKVLRAIQLIDVIGAYRIEVKNSQGKITTKITSDCLIFVFLADDMFREFENPFGIFDGIFGRKK